MHRTRFIVIIITLLSLLISVSTISAKKKEPPPPAVTLLSRWTPQEQLVSDIGIDGVPRTVNLQMSARADKQIWAMDISCLLNLPGIFDEDSADQSMTWGNSWLVGNDATNHFDSTQDSDAGDAGIQYYDSVTERINATITRVGATNSPIGVNGATYTEFLFDLQLDVSEGLVGTSVVNIACDTLTFLDRNGNSLGETVHTNTNDLTIREGYILSGNVSRQGTDNVAEILTDCEHLDTNNMYEATTPVDGLSDAFSFSTDGSSDPLRDFGLYDCKFYSTFGGTEDLVYPWGRTFINLQTPTYMLQPVMLRTGDADENGFITIEADIPFITGNWLDTEPAFTNGDVNGDGIVNEVDLALAAGNVGLSFGYRLDHIFYSVARDFNGTFPNNSLVLGDVFSGSVSPVNSDRAFWPQVSPDGSKIAYYAESKINVDKKGRPTTNPKKIVQTITEEGVFVADTTTFEGIMLVEGNNFAPSWSPSGGQIAYVCSWDGIQNNIEGYFYNNGNICVVDASGGIAQTIIPDGAMSTYAEVFPPAWYNETTLVYGGNSDHPLCPDQLCYYDMLTDTHGLLTINGVNGTTIFANMPVIKEYQNVTYLFYRYFDNTDSELRMGTAVYDSGTNSWAASGVQSLAPGTNAQHEFVDNTDGGVHYYDVSHLLDVMFYEFGENEFHNRYFIGFAPGWDTGEDHIVDGFIGYPTLSFVNQSDQANDDPFGVWDGFDELTAGTDFHAFRPTIDWIP